MNASTPIAEWLKLLDQILLNHWQQQSTTLKHPAFRRFIDSCLYTLTKGGKRFRPQLVWATARVLNLNDQEFLHAAAAIEMLHTYSLIHDDLPCMDDDDMRRGAPALHIAFDEATALLAGDALLTAAFELAAKLGNQSASGQLHFIQKMAQAAGAFGMIGGQVLDLASMNSDSTDATLINQLKTGQLIGLAVSAPLWLTDSLRPKAPLWLDWGQQLGVAFQIKDDLIDHEGDLAQKQLELDQLHNELTLNSRDLCEPADPLLEFVEWNRSRSQ